MSHSYKPNMLAKKLIIILIVFSSLITLFITALQLYLEYERDIGAVETHFQQVELSYIETITESVWEEDIEQLGLIVSGIIKFPGLEYSSVKDNNGHVLASSGLIDDTRLIKKVFPLHQSFRGKVLKVGSLEVLAGLTGVYNRLLERVGIILLSNGIKTLIIAIFLFAVINWLLTRHLGIMSAFANKMDITLSPPLSLERGFLGNKKDEIDQLADSLNAMNDKLSQAYLSIKESEDKLKKHQKHLEDMVDKRNKELLHQQVFTDAVLDNISDGIVACDADGTLSLFNKATREIHGFGQRKLPPDQWAEHYHLYQADGETLMKKEDVPLFRAFRDEKIKNIELMIKREDGTSLVLLASGQAMYDRENNKLGAVVSMHDITDQKKSANDLIKAKETAEQANEAKSNFLSNMSHEIRTPLNAILGMSHIGLRDSTDTKVNDSFNHILDSGKHLLGVINDILDFSKLEAGKLSSDSQPFQLIPTVENAVNLVLERAESKDLKLSLNSPVDLPIWVMGDSLRLQQILLNLLSNAIKFTPKGSIEISLIRDGFQTSFKVSDTGIGLTRKEISKLFTPFEQADKSTARKFGGTGLGLSISKRLAKLMGGDISVESQIDKGSTFTLVLPLEETQASDINSPVVAYGSGPRLKGLCILVAEDVEINRLILEDILEEEGATVIFAEDGQQAIERVEKVGTATIDIILMDVRMPVMDGYEASRLILAKNSELPIIAVTANAMRDDLNQCLAAGMVEHITKPIDPDELVAAILKYVKL